MNEKNNKVLIRDLPVTILDSKGELTCTYLRYSSRFFLL